MAATIKDVAKMAGVSLSTASYALNDRPGVGEGTRLRILEAAKKLNYQPNGSARDLKAANSSKMIGLILDTFSGPFYSQLIKGIEEMTLAKGYDLIAFSSVGDQNSTAVKFLKEKRTDGMIVFANNIDPKLLLSAARPDMPIVVLDVPLQSDYIINIMVDNKGGAFKAVEHLIKLGRKRIAFISGKTNAYDNTQRLEGYKEALRTYGLEDSAKNVYYGLFTRESGYNAAKLMLCEDEVPDAIFAANDEMAIGAMDAIRQTDLTVGKDIAIVGFDDIELAEFTSPPLTTIRQPKYEIGAMAIRHIYQLLDGETATNPIVMPYELIVRESCGSHLVRKSI